MFGGAYIYRGGYRAGGVFFGILGVSTGISGVLSSVYRVDEALYRLLSIGFFFFAVVGTAYLVFKTPRALILSIIPLFFLVQFFVPSLPFILAFAGSALLVGLLTASDFSHLDVTACMKHAKTPLRMVLVPFSRTENLARRIMRTPSAPLLFTLYSLLSVAIVVIPVLVYLALGQNFWLNFLTLISAAYLVVASEECAKGLANLESPSQDMS